MQPYKSLFSETKKPYLEKLLNQWDGLVSYASLEKDFSEDELALMNACINPKLLTAVPFPGSELWYDTLLKTNEGARLIQEMIHIQFGHQ